MKKILKSALYKAGYLISNKNEAVPKDLRGQVSNPIYAKYYARKHNFLVNADFEKCVTTNRFSCEKTGNNPFVNTVADYIRNGDISYSGSKLEEFYNSYDPQNVAELFNLDGELHDDLVLLSTSSFVPPWENADMRSKEKYYQRSIKAETKQRGKELSLNHGHGCFGPISKERGELEINAFVELTKSIKSKGYLRGDGFDEDIRASVLVNGSDYKYLISGGTHRIVVLSALGYKTAPVRVLPRCIPAFIYRNEVDWWPNVKSGLYTREQALKIFDCIFKGDGNY